MAPNLAPEADLLTDLLTYSPALGRTGRAKPDMKGTQLSTRDSKFRGDCLSWSAG